MFFLLLIFLLPPQRKVLPFVLINDFFFALGNWWWFIFIYRSTRFFIALSTWMPKWVMFERREKILFDCSKCVCSSFCAVLTSHVACLHVLHNNSDCLAVCAEKVMVVVTWETNNNFQPLSLPKTPHFRCPDFFDEQAIPQLSIKRFKLVFWKIINGNLWWL